MNEQAVRTSRRDRAVVLVMVLWILVVLTLISYSLLFQVSTEASVTSARKKHLQARTLARAGIAKSIIDLRNDLIFDMSEENEVFDGEGDVWARPEEGKIEFAPSNREEDGFFNARVYDEEGLFNLNNFNATNMIILQKIMERIGYEEEDAQIAAAAIVDWRDGDTAPVVPNAIGSDEGIAYAIIKAKDEGGSDRPEDVEPLIFRNENYLTVDELLEVYGVTPELFFGPGSPEAEFYRKQFGEPVGSRFRIEQRRRSRRDEGPPPGLRDYVTVYGSGVLNMNTAPHHVLAVFAEATGLDDGERFADRVIRTRRGGKRDNFDNRNAFKNRGELMENAEIQSVMATGSVVYPIGVTSTAFRIIAEGVTGEVTARMEVIAVRQMGNFTRSERLEDLDRARERRDQNSARYERRINQRNEQQILYPYVRIIQAIEY